MAQQLICICCVCGFFCLGIVLFWHIFALVYFCLSVFLYFSGANLSSYLTQCHADWNRVIWPSCSFVAARAELQWLRVFWHDANSLSVCSTHCVHSWCTKCITNPFSKLRIPIYRQLPLFDHFSFQSRTLNAFLICLRNEISLDSMLPLIFLSNSNMATFAKTFYFPGNIWVSFRSYIHHLSSVKDQWWDWM